jgi:aspartate aminotransferase-like enzyme
LPNTYDDRRLPDDLQSIATGHDLPVLGYWGWEAAIVNTLSPGDTVLMVETGHFATLWRQMAARWGLEVASSTVTGA